MEITSIRLDRIRNQGKLIAVANVTVDNMLVIHGIRILLSSEKGMMIAMPNVRLANGKYSDIVHPISKGARSVFENLLIPAAEKMYREGRDSAFYSMRHSNREHSATVQTLDEFEQTWSDSAQLVSDSIRDEIAAWLDEK